MGVLVSDGVGSGMNGGAIRVGVLDGRDVAIGDGVVLGVDVKVRVGLGVTVGVRV